MAISSFIGVLLMKKVLSLLLALVLLLAVLPMNVIVVLAAEPNWQDAGVPESVLLSVGDVFEIYTANQLAWVAQRVNAPSGSSRFAGFTVKLMNDIDLSAREWTPIGGWNGTAVDTSKVFAGKFDGNNKIITGLRIGSEALPDNKYEYLGLFGSDYYDYSLSIKGVGIVDGQIYSGRQSASIGLLAGCIRGDASVNNCYSTGKVIGNGYVGGLIGRKDYGNITNSFSTTDISSDSHSEGLVSYNNDGNIINCYATGNMTIRGSSSMINYYWCLSERIVKTIDEMKSQAFVDFLNENGKYSSAMWLMDTSGKNQGFPVLSGIAPNPMKYWLENAIEPTENSGTYEIYSAGHLAWISLQVSNGKNFKGKTVKLMNNIDLSGKEWTPIGYNANGYGTYIEGDYFKGNFDGNYMKITGLKIGTEENPSDEYRNIGLFGVVSGGTIKNVGLENVQIYYSRAESIGALAGRTAPSVIFNCYSTGIICYSTGIIINQALLSLNSLSESSSNSTGGASSGGGSGGGSGGTVIIVEPIATNSSYAVGGLIGDFGGTSINNCYSAVDVSGSNSIGGLTGINGGVSMDSCYAIGDLTGGSSTVAGGLIGSGNSYESTRSYWNRDAVHIRDGFLLANSAKKGVGNGDDTTVGKTLAELRQQSTFVDWDFTNTWAIDPSFNGGLPYLRGFTMEDVSVSGVSVSNSSIMLDIGESNNIFATISPANATNQSIIWSSSNPSVAEVDAGRITAVGLGIAQITATTADGSFEAHCDVIVNAPPTDYNINSVTLRTTGGGTLTSIPTSGDFVIRTNITMNKVRVGDVIIIALYDNNGKLLRINRDRTFITNNLDVGVPANFSQQVSQVPDKTIASIKAFIWNGLNTIEPLSNIENYPVQ